MHNLLQRVGHGHVLSGGLADANSIEKNRAKKSIDVEQIEADQEFCVQGIAVGGVIVLSLIQSLVISDTF